MKKFYIICFVILAGGMIVGGAGCASSPQTPKSSKNDASMWQQFQSEKALEGLDKE